MSILPFFSFCHFWPWEFYDKSAKLTSPGNKLKCKICNKITETIFRINNSIKTQAVCKSRHDSINIPKITIKVQYCPQCDFYQIEKSQFDHYEDIEYFCTTELSDTQRNYQKWLMTKIKGYLRSPIAEIGPGDGYFGKLLSEYKYMGFEPSKRSYEECKKKGLNVINKYFFLANSYRTIIARQVLEHIEDIDGFLLKIRKSLDLDGYAIFEVPNIGKAIKNNRLMDFCPEHLNYFSISSLVRYFSKNGFDIERIEKTYEEENLVIVVKSKSQFNPGVFEKKVDFSNYCFWGAGSRGVSYCHLVGAKPKYFVDSDANKIGKFIPSTDIVIKSPEYLFSDKSCNSIVITGLFYFDEIIEIIRKNGFKGEIYKINEKNELEKC